MKPSALSLEDGIAALIILISFFWTVAAPFAVAVYYCLTD